MVLNTFIKHFQIPKTYRLCNVYNFHLYSFILIFFRYIVSSFRFKITIQAVIARKNK